MEIFIGRMGTGKTKSMMDKIKANNKRFIYVGEFEPYLDIKFEEIKEIKELDSCLQILRTSDKSFYIKPEDFIQLIETDDKLNYTLLNIGNDIDLFIDDLILYDGKIIFNSSKTSNISKFIDKTNLNLTISLLSSNNHFNFNLNKEYNLIECNFKGNIEYSGNISLRLPKSLHAYLANKAKAEGVSLNQYLLYIISMTVK